MSTETQSLRLAMWSGPRNISTAMMRAWENRADTAVWDEPLYAHYLAHTGIDHPGREKIVAAGDPDWRSVIATLTGPAPHGKAIFYQKHMTHHLLAHIDRSWLNHVTNCFLIRHPREVLLSYSKTRTQVTAEDVGFPQQAEIFEFVQTHTDATPLIIDTADFLQQPRGFLELICTRLNMVFSECMLSWPPGPRDSDGVWAEFWYAAVQASTGFAPYRPRHEPLPPRLEEVAQACMPYYEFLHRYRLKI